MGVGLAIMAVAISGRSYALMFPGLLLWGIAMPFLFVPPQRAVMNAVPPHQQGQAGGIAMSSQLLGATIGMAVCSTLFSMTSSFEVVFVAAPAFSFAVFAVGWPTIENPARAAAGEAASGQRSLGRR